MAQQPTLYEAMYILDPELSEEEAERVMNDIHQYVEDNNGEVVSDELFGRRRLAYEIDDYTEGVYRILYFRGDGTTVGELRHEFGLIEPVIRGMVVAANPDAIYTSAEPQVSETEEESEEAAELAEPILTGEQEPEGAEELEADEAAETVEEAEVPSAEEESEEAAELAEPLLTGDQEPEGAEELEADEAAETVEEAEVSSESEASQPSDSAAEEISEQQPD